MKIAIALIFVSTLCGASIRDMEFQTVLVTNEGFLGGGKGSGVLLDETHVLTCAHMVETAKDELFVYTFPLASVVRAKVGFIDKEADLMVLDLAQPVVVTRYPTFEHHWTEGDSITVIGNALGSMKWVVTRGVLAGEERDFLLTDARVNPGNSGGPWFDADGNIVAITDWGIGPFKSEEGINGGISAKAIEAFMNERERAKGMAEKLNKLLGI